MGRGYIGFKKLPKKKKVYGDESFFVRPIYDYVAEGTSDKLISGTFYVRPVTEEEDIADGYIFGIEGEFSFGESSLSDERKTVRGLPISFKWYDFDEENFTDEQLKQVKAFCDGGVA